MSTMAWYPPQPQSTPSAASDELLEFFDSQSAGWPLWSLGGPADGHGNHSASGVRVDEKHGNHAGSSDSDLGTDDIFMSQFSDEEMRRMDDASPFEALDMFPDSMHRLLSYENMLSGVLTGSEDQDATLMLGVDTMDTCGFPLFSHDLQQDTPPPPPPPKDHQQAAASVTKRSRSVVADERSSFFEALVLQDLEDVVFQLTKRTRVCFRDAFFRLAESSRAKCSAAPSSQTVAQQAAAEGNAPSSISTTQGCCPERETNAIDRTVADLTMKPPRPVPLVSRPYAGDDSAGAEAQSATSWTTTA